MLQRLFIAALWPPSEKGLSSWLLFAIFNCVFVTFPCSILGQVRNLIVSSPELCRHSYFAGSATLVNVYVDLVVFTRIPGTS